MINNGIDLNVFKPTPSEFRKKYHLEKKKIILGVANVWDDRKGFNTFIELSSNLNDNYQIIMVGVTEKQKNNLPSNIIGITRTNNIKELAEIYSSADIFVNPTLEDNFPTVNLESIACGTPIITFDTGGSPESLTMKCGSVVEKRNIKLLIDTINEMITSNSIDNKECLKQSKKYNKDDKFPEYVKIYGML